jgi:hypothetical protein
MAMEDFLGGLQTQTTPIASAAHGYGFEVLGPHMRRQEVGKRCLENIFFSLFGACEVASSSGGLRKGQVADETRREEEAITAAGHSHRQGARSV